jgi:hypothetical protein
MGRLIIEVGTLSQLVHQGPQVARAASTSLARR